MASLVGAFYYLRIVKLMYFDERPTRSPIDARGDNRALLSANGLALLLFGILPQPLMGLCVVALAQSRVALTRRGASVRRRGAMLRCRRSRRPRSPSDSRCASASSSPASST